MKRTNSATAMLAVAVLAITGSAWAQQGPPPPPPGTPGAQQGPPPQQAGQDDGDAPNQGVARISLINGEVLVRHGDAGDQAAGAVNAPLFANDRISTDANSRAELEFDAANVLRLGPSTEVRMNDLAYRRYQVQLALGTITIHVIRDNDAQFELQTPSIAVHPSRRGSYRLTTSADGTTEITVRAGSLDVFSPKGSEAIPAGKTMLVRGDPNDPEFQVVDESAPDDFDRWNEGRDRELEQSVSSRYVPPDVYGTESLDAYGAWNYDDPYGWVWVPRVAADWAPYRDGRWVDTDYYGWTWYSADPWGWAPYHYGRWYRGGHGWSWYPGAYGGRNYWRPALVGFFGWGSPGFGGGVGFGFGHLGWVPLAPYERFHPWYGAGGRNFAVVNNFNVSNTYRNARFDRGFNGVTSVRAGDFGRGGINQNNFVRAQERDLRGAGEVRGGLPFQAGQGSRQFTDRTVNARSFPQSNNNTRFFSRPQTTPNAGVRGSAGGSQAGNGSTFRGGPVESPRSAGGGAANGNSGWRQMGQGSQPQAGFNRGSSAPQAQGNAPQANGGWRTFDRANGASPSSRPQVQSAPQQRGRSNEPQGGGSPRGFSAPQGGGNPRSFSTPQGGGQQPVRINPSIVRERPSFNSNSRPSAPAPQMNRGGGGFGSARTGGGGGSRPSGGGGGSRGGGGGHSGGGHR